MVYIVEAKNFQNPGTAVPLGNQGENKVRGVVFDITDFVEELGADGVVKVKVQRPGEALPYDAELVDEYDEGDVERYKILWTLTDTDTGVTGKGRCQLTYTVDDPESQSDPIVKTIVVSTEVLPSLGVSAPSPNPSSDIVARINEAVVEAEGARDAAVDAKNAAESAEEDATSAKSAAVEAKNTAESKASDSEAYAVGTRGGEPVESTDPAYHNNSKYYADYVDETIDEFARIDGYYESMTVGNAEQLISTVYVEDSDPYIRRTAGGSADISNRKYEEFVGGSVSWSQLFDDTKIIASGHGLTISVANHVVSITGTPDAAFVNLVLNTDLINVQPNRVYCASGKLNSSQSEAVATFALFDSSWNGRGAINCGAALKVSSDTTRAIIRLSGMTVNTAISATLSGIGFFDLTLMFGSAIADYIYQLEQSTAGAGVAFFKKLFPKTYYPYNAGEIISVKTSGVKTTGLNQWDEDWEQGRYDDSGAKVASTTAIRSKNFIKVFPSTTYYFESSEENLGRLCFYDIDQNFIETKASASDAEFTTPDGCYFITLSTSTEYGGTYKNDICINLAWSGTYNGDYEPYDEHTYALSNIDLRGVIKKDASNNLYYDGDIYKSDGTVIRKYGIVDLGTLEWSVDSGTGYSRYASEAITGMLSTTARSMPIVCSKYPCITDGRGITSIPDKSIYNGTIGGVGRAYIHDSSYETASSLAAALSGVYLVYELATPVEETEDPYAFSMIVNDWGTEEFVDGRTVEMPVGHETKYPANLRDKLQHLPSISSAGDGTYLVRQEGSNMTLEKLPDAPSEDGAYNLTVFINNGSRSYSWEDAVSKSYQGDLNAENYVISMRKWFKDNYISGMTDLTQLCERWYDITKTGWIGGTQFSKTSNASTGTRVGDNIGKSCTPSTSTVKGQDSFANIPLFYTVDCNAYIDSDGKPRITAIENVMGDFVRNDPEKIVAAIQMTGWVKYEEDTTSYTYNYADENADGLYKPLPEAVNMDGSVRSFVVHGKYGFGDNWECCSGKKTKLWNVSYESQRTGVHTAWGDQYCGRTSADDSFLKLMTYIKYASLTLDTIMPGCLAYNYQYPAAVSEEGVERIILTTAQANNFVVGSSVLIGNPTAFSSGTALNLNRNQEGLRAKADRVKITSIEEIEIDGVTYAAVNIDNGGVTFDTTPNTITTAGDAPTYISTIAWDTGSTDAVLGFDGSPTNYSSAKEPIKLQGIELLTGAYFIRGDTILEYYKDGMTQCYRERICRDASLLSSSLTSDYKTPSYSLTYDITSDSWNYIKRIGFDESLPEAMFASEIGGSSSTYTRNAIYLLANTTGVRECQAFGYLLSGVSNGGLSFVNANHGLSHATWHISGGLSLTGCRGEYTGA